MPVHGPRSRSTLALITFVAAVAVTPPLLAEDWTQFRGRDRLGVWHETGIVETLPQALKVDVAHVHRIRVLRSGGRRWTDLRLRLG